jgi:hypothetical protein
VIVQMVECDWCGRIERLGQCEDSRMFVLPSPRWSQDVYRGTTYCSTACEKSYENNAESMSSALQEWRRQMDLAVVAFQADYQALHPHPELLTPLQKTRREEMVG